jgi:uncharacterized protein (AIM24 family)
MVYKCKLFLAMEQKLADYWEIIFGRKRLLTGENLFMTVYTNTSSQKRQVTFAAPYSGKIIPLDLSKLGGRVICQKDSFLCAAKGVSVGLNFKEN